MYVEELRRELEKLAVPPTLYSLDGSLKADVYVLQPVHGRWTCFYVDERGNENDRRWFAGEDAACRYFLQMLQKECAYRQRYR